MREAVATLLKLQEMELVLEEAAIIHSGRNVKGVSEMKSRMQTLRQNVPPPVLRRYDRLRRTGIGACAVQNGFCACCHLRVPVGDLNRMRRGDTEWVCPNCGRFLMIEHAE